MSENIKQAYAKGRKHVVYIPARGKFGKYSKSAKPVDQIDISTGAIIKRFDSIVEANRLLGIKSGLITRCCKEEINKTHGFKWRYAI
jgi:hypothetical protein